MKQVAIIEISTGKTIFTYPIVLGCQNYNPNNEEYASEAWNCAVEDKLVDPDDYAKYRSDIH